MSPAARLWARIVASTALSVVLYALLAPPHPEPHLSSLVALLAGACAGTALFVVLVRRRPRVGFRPGSPLVFLGLQGYLALWAANEEVIWRRVVLGELLGVGVAAALLASTFGFALAHRSRPFFHVGTGAVFGAVYLLTGALGASVAAHWTYNALVRGNVLRNRNAERVPT